MASWDVTKLAAETVVGGGAIGVSGLRLDDTHALLCWGGNAFLGTYAQVFSFNPGTGAVTAIGVTLTMNGAVFNQAAYGTSCCQIDATHFAVMHAGVGGAGMIQVLEVNLGTWAVTAAGATTALDIAGASACYLADASHVVGVRTANAGGVYLDVFSVDLGTWAVTALGGASSVNVSGTGSQCDMVKADSTHMVIAWRENAGSGRIRAFSVNLTSWVLAPIGVAATTSATNSNNRLTYINDTHYLLAYTGSGSDGFAQVYAADGAWTISAANVAYEFDTANGLSPFLARLTELAHIVCYTSSDGDGWALALVLDGATWAVSAPGAAVEFSVNDVSGHGCVVLDSDGNTINGFYSNTGGGFSVVALGVAIVADCGFDSLTQTDRQHYRATFVPYPSGAQFPTQAEAENPIFWTLTLTPADATLAVLTSTRVSDYVYDLAMTHRVAAGTSLNVDASAISTTAGGFCNQPGDLTITVTPDAYVDEAAPKAVTYAASPTGELIEV